MSLKEDEKIFINGAFKVALKIILQTLHEKQLISDSEYKNEDIAIDIQECQTFRVASALISLKDGSKITFVYNDQNSFILSNIEEGKPFIQFSTENIERIITCLF